MTIKQKKKKKKKDEKKTTRRKLSNYCNLEASMIKSTITIFRYRGAVKANQLRVDTV